MAMSNAKVDISIRHMWLIKLINYPLVTMGFYPYVPKMCVNVSKPYFVEDL
jgi:hypothetical protein